MTSNDCVYAYAVATAKWEHCILASFATLLDAEHRAPEHGAETTKIHTGTLGAHCPNTWTAHNKNVDAWSQRDSKSTVPCSLLTSATNLWFGASFEVPPLSASHHCSNQVSRCCMYTFKPALKRPSLLNLWRWRSQQCSNSGFVGLPFNIFNRLASSLLVKCCWHL